LEADDRVTGCAEFPSFKLTATQNVTTPALRLIAIVRNGLQATGDWRVRPASLTQATPHQRCSQNAVAAKMLARLHSVTRGVWGDIHEARCAMPLLPLFHDLIVSRFAWTQARTSLGIQTAGMLSSGQVSNVCSMAACAYKA